MKNEHFQRLSGLPVMNSNKNIPAAGKMPGQTLDTGHSLAVVGVVHDSWITPSLRSRELLPDMIFTAPYSLAVGVVPTLQGLFHIYWV